MTRTHPHGTSESAPTGTPANAGQQDDTFVQEWRQWHRAHEQALADPHGFLAVTGLHWLTGQPQRFAGVPGQWQTGPDGVVVDLAGGEEITIDGRAVTGRYGFGPIEERGGVTVGIDGGVLEVARRGGHDILRPRHPDNPLRTAFRGTPAYPPSVRWVLSGRYVPFESPRPTTVGAAVEGLQHVYDAPGRVEFAVDGVPLSLTAFNGRSPGSLLVLFTDATSGVTTYAANRSLAVDAPDERGTVTVDFNRATNLPCAYTDFATCPLPPAENRLSVAIEAGEKIPYERLAAGDPAQPSPAPTTGRKS
ncbi:DUF1684 domain-containing protein [Micromonospora sp. WMMD1082]|uniref:DUF1684 domain-containing protein n=1 Tax=Micromonospora sp. WMMD1082 TaxID=3016104 RepID=UPI002415EB9B|nr:DUF1684 domain-containing protein [Micromonospora sp. WMMD1082]MDG4797925.1 DUF1684 domain-containing protein [Micromonospora sp. WMMD1082]